MYTVFTVMFALSAGSCPQTKMLNTSKYGWNDYDMDMLKQAKKRCGELYPDAPCVKLFKKYDKLSYSVICGAPTKAN